METFQHKVLSERTVFLSYAHRNRRVAARLEGELEARNVHIFRDATSLIFAPRGLTNRRLRLPRQNTTLGEP